MGVMRSQVDTDQLGIGVPDLQDIPLPLHLSRARDAMVASPGLVVRDEDDHVNLGGFRIELSQRSSTISGPTPYGGKELSGMHDLALRAQLDINHPTFEREDSRERVLPQEAGSNQASYMDAHHPRGGPSPETSYRA